MTKKIFIILFCIFVCHCNNSFSQANVEWFRTYSAGWGKNFVNDFAMDSLGNSYLTGYVSRDPANQSSAFGTVKYDQKGVLQWAKLYEGSSNFSNAAGNALVIDSYGNVYVTGTCTDVDSAENYCTIKYNSTGETIWIKKYNSSAGGRDEAADITLDQDNNLYVTGYTYYSDSPYTYFWNTVKYDSNGNQLWVTRYEGNLSKGKRSRKIILDDQNNVYVCGYITGDSSSRDFCTVKYNQSGQQQWVSVFNNSNLSDEPSDMIIDNFGNIHILGQSYVNLNSDFYTSLVKYDNNGNELWHVMSDSIGHQGSMFYNKISFKLDSENNTYIATTYGYQCCTIKYDSSGEQQWMSKYKGPQYAFCKGIGINIDKYGYLYTTGFARGFGNVEPFIILKYNSEGTILRELSYHVYNDVEFDEGAFIGFDKSNNFYIGGNHVNNNSIIKYSLLKYSQSVGIQNISSEIPNDFNLYQNYPNPFNPKTIIRFDVTPQTGGVVQLKVYDVLGNEVRTLVNEKKSPGTYEVDFDGNDLSSGVYYYKLSAGNFSLTKRMLLLK